MPLLDLFELNEQKQQAFAKGSLENKFTKIFLDFRKFEKRLFSKKELQKEIQLKNHPQLQSQNGCQELSF
jgi:hypothetical protein